MTGWNNVDSGSEEVYCFRRPNDTDFDTFKADMFVDKPPQAIARYIFENWGAINEEFNEEDVEEFKEVKRLNEDVAIYQVLTKPHGVVSGRQLLVSAVYLDLGNSTYAIVGVSIDDPDYPCPEGKVRGELRMGLNLFEPAAGDTNRTHMQSLTLLDPKGSIPAMIVNGILGNRAKLYA
jgi:hypothetical protein